MLNRMTIRQSGRPTVPTLLLVALLALPAAAEQPAAAAPRSLTLDQAMSLAMAKNRDIEKAREYARYVQGRYVEERSAALPQLSLNGAAELARDESQQSLYGMPPRQYQRTLDITLSQPLFTWGRIRASIRAAEAGLKTADEQLRLYQQAVYRDVSAAYYNILLAKELQRFAAQNLAQKQRLLDQAQRKLAAGVATDYDVLAASVAVENARPEVIRTENGIRTARERLRFLLALTGEEIDAVGSLDQPTRDRPVPSDFGQALALAHSKRPELADQRLRISQYGELVTAAAAENKPRLDLKGSAGWHWMDVTQAGSSLSSDGAAWRVGLYLSFPFFDGLRTNGRLAQVKSDLRTRQIEETRLQDAIALEVHDSWNALGEAAEIVQALSGTVRQAERLLQMAEMGYEYGVKNRLEVDDAQLNVQQALTNLARALRDYRVARASFEWAVGIAGE